MEKYEIVVQYKNYTYTSIPSEYNEKELEEVNVILEKASCNELDNLRFVDGNGDPIWFSKKILKKSVIHLKKCE